MVEVQDLNYVCLKNFKKSSDSVISHVSREFGHCKPECRHGLDVCVCWDLGLDNVQKVGIKQACLKLDVEVSVDGLEQVLRRNLLDFGQQEQVCPTTLVHLHGLLVAECFAQLRWMVVMVYHQPLQIQVHLANRSISCCSKVGTTYFSMCKLFGWTTKQNACHAKLPK